MLLLSFDAIISLTPPLHFRYFFFFAEFSFRLRHFSPIFAADGFRFPDATD
jgi:hypothetical protein